jgi:hypothetical protein
MKATNSLLYVGGKKVFATQIDVRSSDVYFLVVGTPPIQE